MQLRPSVSNLKPSLHRHLKPAAVLSLTQMSLQADILQLSETETEQTVNVQKH